MCYRRTTGVYCHTHDRRLEREIERRRKAKESADRAAVPIQPAPPRVRRSPTKHSSSGWAAYKTKHPERAAFYASSTWRVMRDRHLKANPTCVVCGGRASHADHVVSIALGGTDPTVLKIVLKVKDGAGGSYSWVECGSCDTAWQVPYYAESVG